MVTVCPTNRWLRGKLPVEFAHSNLPMTVLSRPAECAPRSSRGDGHWSGTRLPPDPRRPRAIDSPLNPAGYCKLLAVADPAEAHLADGPWINRDLSDIPKTPIPASHGLGQLYLVAHRSHHRTHYGGDDEDALSPLRHRQRRIRLNHPGSRECCQAADCNTGMSPECNQPEQSQPSSRSTTQYQGPALEAAAQ